jgi:hypothetical protein
MWRLREKKMKKILARILTVSLISSYSLKVNGQDCNTILNNGIYDESKCKIKSYVH